MSDLDFTNDELLALGELERKTDHLRTAVASLVHDYDTGLFVWGEGGIGKSYVVEETLKQLKASYVHHNSRMTGRGLFDALRADPTKIHLIEDAETLFTDKLALGVLRSACWSQSKKRPREREITWASFSACGSDNRFVFTGSILVISNADVTSTSAELRAVKSRVNTLNMDVTSAEMFALMKKICQDGYTFGEERS